MLDIELLAVYLICPCRLQKPMHDIHRPVVVWWHLLGDKDIQWNFL